MRQRALSLLNNNCKNVLTAREIESGIHSISTNINMYRDKIQQVTHNLQVNDKLKEKGGYISVLTDSEMAEGTIVSDIGIQSKLRFERFDRMLQDKYETLNDKTYRTTLKCHRCGSPEVTWEQKQTRGADEAMTVFCTCTKCHNRWTMR